MDLKEINEINSFLNERERIVLNELYLGYSKAEIAKKHNCNRGKIDLIVKKIKLKIKKLN